MIKNRTTVLEVFQFIVYFMYIIYHQIYTRVSKTKYNKYVTEYNRVFVRYTCISFIWVMKSINNIQQVCTKIYKTGTRVLGPFQYLSYTSLSSYLMLSSCRIARLCLLSIARRCLLICQDFSCTLLFLHRVSVDTDLLSCCFTKLSSSTLSSNWTDRHFSSLFLLGVVSLWTSLCEISFDSDNTIFSVDRPFDLQYLRSAFSSSLKTWLSRDRFLTNWRLLIMIFLDLSWMLDVLTKLRTESELAFIESYPKSLLQDSSASSATERNSRDDV